MKFSLPMPEFPFERKGEWRLWRGSPELLAHVVRVALRFATEDSQEAHCMIDFKVAEDHEIFSSPDEFVTNVTREALRKFKDIHIDVVGKALAINVTLRWRRPWWATGRGEDAEVILAVRGEEQPSVEDAFAGVRTAIKRGGTERGVPQSVLIIGVMVVTAIVAAVGTGSALYLLDLPEDVVSWVAFAAWILGAVIGLVWGSWMYPSLEVASSGQMNLSRLVKVLGPLIATLIVGAIAKALYGGG
jgi:hypothetical protein